ncbi:hypothetical protein KAS50_00995 [bacterium]|nr:hypothetical protein [bacterium]
MLLINPLTINKLNNNFAATKRIDTTKAVLKLLSFALTNLTTTNMTAAVININIAIAANPICMPVDIS